MRRLARSRDECVDLLVRRPLTWTSSMARAEFVVDRAAQVRELVALVDRGLLTGEEFERQRRKVVGP